MKLVARLERRGGVRTLLLPALGLFVAASCSSGGGSASGFGGGGEDDGGGSGSDASPVGASSGRDGSAPGSSSSSGTGSSSGAASGSGSGSSSASSSSGGSSSGSRSDSGAGGSSGSASGSGSTGSGSSGGSGSTSSSSSGGASRDAGAAGEAGAGGWLSGYTATMFGNDTSGDCSGVANFSDTTNIARANCVGSKMVTLATFASGVANNASYYGAPGDLSSIWAGGQCTCQPGQTANSAGVCPTAPQCPMEQDCAKCFEVKCDPNGTGKFSNGDRRDVASTGVNYCNASSTVVIQVIDACPHNHPANTWWCTTHDPNHIDLSCSALEAISANPSKVGSVGWLDVQVRPVDCSVGLGPH